MPRYVVINDGEPAAVEHQNEIYYKSDFKLRYKFVDHRYTPTALIPPKYINVILTYSVYGRDETYVASCIDGVCTNCFIDENTNTLVVIFQDYNLGPGKLMHSYEYLVNDPDFPNSKAKRFNGAYTGIILTDNLY